MFSPIASVAILAANRRFTLFQGSSVSLAVQRRLPRSKTPFGPLTPTSTTPLPPDTGLPPDIVQGSNNMYNCLQSSQKAGLSCIFFFFLVLTHRLDLNVLKYQKCLCNLNWP